MASVGTITTNTNTGNDDPSPLDTTVTLDAGADRALVCQIGIEHDTNSTPTSLSVTFDPGGANEAAFTQVALATQTDHQCAQFGLLEADLPTAGSYTVRVAWTSGDIGNEAAIVAGFINLADYALQAIPTNTVTDIEASASQVSMPITTETDGSIVISGVSSDTTQVEEITTYANGTERWDLQAGTNNSRAACATEVRATAGAGTVTFDNALGSNVIMVGVAVEWSAAAAHRLIERGVGRGIGRGIMRGV